MPTEGRKAPNSRHASLGLNHQTEAGSRNALLHGAETGVPWLWGSHLREPDMSGQLWMVMGENFRKGEDDRLPNICVILRNFPFHQGQNDALKGVTFEATGPRCLFLGG